MLAETDQDLKISKATEFLQTFPDSGLTPMVHTELAGIYRQRVDVDNFLKHGEEALKEIPNNANLLAITRRGGSLSRLPSQPPKHSRFWARSKNP